MSAMSTTAAGKAVRGAFRAVLGSQAGHKTDRAAFYEGYRVLMEKARAWDEISRGLGECARPWCERPATTRRGLCGAHQDAADVERYEYEREGGSLARRKRRRE